MAKDLAVVLNSGSINSAVATALAAQKYRPILVHVDGGSDTPSRLRAAYDQQVAHFKPYREHTLAMPFFSSLSSGKAAGSASDPRQQTPVGPRVIELLPHLAAAARFAHHYQAAALYLGLRIGQQSDDLAQVSEYVQVWSELLQLPCGMAELDVQAPLLELEPWQVVDLGFQTSVPFERTWSCEQDGGEPCGACRGCRVRDIAFQQAGKPDPLRATRKL